MGSRIEDDSADGPVRNVDTLESLLQSTDRDTAEIVEALRESGPRQHVSESSVDDVLEELSRPQADEGDGAFALSGGPTRTISTTGIDEVFETLEAEASSLPPEPQDGATARSHAGGDAATAGSSGTSTAVASAGPDRRRLPARASMAEALEHRRGDDGDSFDSLGTLSGAGPTRTVSDQSVDDILSLLDEEAESGEPGASSAEALRPDDAGAELVALLHDDDPESSGDEADCGDDERSEVPARPSAPDSVTVETSSTLDVDTAASALGATVASQGADTAELARHAERDGRRAADGPSDESGQSGTVDPAPDTAGDVAPATAEAAPTTDEPRPLVTQAELEEIASLVSNAEPTGARSPASTTPKPADEPARGDAADTHVRRSETRSRIEAAVEPTYSSGRAGIAVSVDAVIAPTDASTGGRSWLVADDPSRSNPVEPTSSPDGAGWTGVDDATRTFPASGDREPAVLGRFGALWGQVLSRLRRR